MALFSGNALAEVFIKVTVDSDEANRKMKDATKSASSFGDTFKAILSSNIVTKVFDLAVQGAQKAAQAFVNFIKDVVQLYAEYEQLEGGIKKIFGVGNQTIEQYAESQGKSIDEVRDKYNQLVETQNMALKDAWDAWQFAGLSANQYMGILTSISGALMGDLNYNSQEAVEYSRRAVTDMSDIANTYGMTLDEVSGYYISFSRGLYQTLDTLTSGTYKGTKEGAKSLINDMADLKDIQEELGVTVEKDNLSYANFVNAMSVYNKKVGIAGTTAAEASGTIQGSINQLKAAWENLKIGIGDPNADLNQLLDNVLSSLESAMDNLLPVIERALDGIAELITKLAPKIEEMMPGLIEKLTPVIESLLESLISIATAVIIDLMPEILDAVQQIWDAVMENLEENHPILAGILEVFMASTGLSVGQFLGDIIQSTIDFFANITATILEKLDAIRTWISEKWEAIKENAREKWEDIKTAISDKWEEIKENVREKVESVRSLVTEKWEALKSNTREKWESIKSTVRDKLENLRTTAREKAESIRSSLSEKWDSIKTNAREKWESIKSSIKEKIDAIKNIFPLSIGKIFSNIKVPTISVTKGEAPFGIGGLGTKPSISIGWKSAFAKAYDNPWLIDTPTILSSMMFGDKGNYNGGEIVYGHDALMDDIREATGGSRDGAILAMLNNIYELLQEGQTITIGRRDFARLVYEVN